MLTARCMYVCALSFRMLNWREPSRWLLFRGGLAAPQLVVRSDLLTWLLPNEPTAVHLLPSRTNTPTEIRVQWTTRDERSPRVFWVRLARVQQKTHQPRSFDSKPRSAQGFASGAYAFNASATSGVLVRVGLNPRHASVCTLLTQRLSLLSGAATFAATPSSTGALLGHTSCRQTPRKWGGCSPACSTRPR